MFDYGCDEKEIAGVVSSLKVWPTEGKRTALVDADSIAYIIGYTSDLQQYLKAKRSKNMQDTDVWMSKINHANFILNGWVDAAGCDSAKLYLTDGANNFRIAIAKTKPYKGQRVEEKPPFFHEIREWLMTFHSAIMSDHCEADDEISIEAWKRHLAFDGKLWTGEHKKFSDFVIVSGDKDLGIIPGWRCPPKGQLEWVEPLGYLLPVWREREIMAYEYWPLFKGKVRDLNSCSTLIDYKGRLQVRNKNQLECPKDKWEMDYLWHYKYKRQDTFTRGPKKNLGKFKRVMVGKKKTEYIYKLKGTGLKFFYSQLLTGDAVDNYPGLPGFGYTKTFEILDDAKSEQDLVSHVKHLYKNYYGEAWKKHLNEMGQLAWMQTKKEELWEVPTEGESSFPK